LATFLCSVGQRCSIQLHLLLDERYINCCLDVQQTQHMSEVFRLLGIHHYIKVGGQISRLVPYVHLNEHGYIYQSVGVLS